MTDARHTRAWRKLRDQVIHEEPVCWLQFPSICTQVSTTGDHIIPIEEAPERALDRDNVRGACGPCNLARGRTPAHLLEQPKPPALDFFGEGASQSLTPSQHRGQ